MLSKRAALLVIGLLVLAVAVPLATQAATPITVGVSDAFSFTENAVLTSRVIAINETLVSCRADLTLTSCSPLAIFEQMSYSVASTVTTVTSTVTQWITSHTTVGGYAIVADTPFDALLTGFVLPGITLAVFLAVAFAMRVRSFPVILLFGAVAFMAMAANNIVPTWTILLVIVGLSVGLSNVLGKIYPLNPIYGTWTFLLGLGIFMQIYSSATPALSAQTVSSSSGLSCIGQIIPGGPCVVSDIINGLTSALSIAGQVTGLNTPWGTAVTLGLTFLGIGIVAGIFGFGVLMNVVFSVGMTLSVYYYINAEMALFSGLPSLMVLMLNGVVGIATVYMFREAFSGVGGSSNAADTGGEATAAVGEGA